MSLSLSGAFCPTILPLFQDGERGGGLGVRHDGLPSVEGSPTYACQ